MKKIISFFKYENLSLAVSLFAFSSVIVMFQNCGKNISTTTVASQQASIDVPDQVDSNTDDPQYETRVQVNKLVANRVLMTNIFISVFGKEMSTFASSVIGWKPTEFGSAFTYYDTVVTSDCNTHKTPYTKCNHNKVDVAAPASPALNVSREAYRIRACHYGVSKYAMNAIQKIDSKATDKDLPDINAESMKKAFRLFFRTQPLPGIEVTDALIIASKSQKSHLARWKAVLLPICLSSQWQVL